MPKTINKNLPNALTVFRMCCVPFYMLFMLLPGVPSTSDGRSLNVLAAGILFALAMITDLFDGRLARKYHLVSDFGKLWDPLADKLMITAALLSLMCYGRCHAAVVLIVVARELIVTGLRATAAGRGNVIAANGWGKAKTLSQTIFVGWTMLLIFLEDMGLPEAAPWYDALRPALDISDIVVCGIMTALTVISGVIYFVQNAPDKKHGA